MPPVIAAVQAAFAWIGTQLAAIAAWKIGEFAIGSFLLNTVIGLGLNALLAPRQKSRVAERQADALQLSLGEGPREFVFGKMGLGGALLNAWNYGGKHGTDWNVFAIKLADHEIDALESFYVNDELQTFSGDGAVSAYTVDGSEHLRVYFQRGTQSAPPTAITSNSGGKWTSTHVAKGCAIVYVEYKANEKVWPQGRPRFVWNVRGARLYDPRKDSTVAGGSGAHRWSDKTTWEFSTNLYLAFCNWSWGITDAGASGGKLILGRGLTFDQFPAAARFAKLNICDEDVTLKAGGTQKRYHGGGLIASTQTFADAVDDFAACMGGEIVNRDGVVDVEPGASKTVSVAIDEGDLLAFEPVRFVPHLDFDSRCNTAVARFTDPDQLWQDASAPMRRSAADIVSDKGYFEKTFDLVFVQNYITAQRIAEIRRRQARLERSFTIALGPRFIGLEIGDWITLTSTRYLGGSTVTFVVTGLQQEIAYEQGRIRFRIALALREIASSVYAWTAATDEIDKDQALDLTPFRPTTASFAGFTLTAIQIAGAGGTTSPTIRVNWTGVTDPAYKAALIEYRVQGTTNVQQERSPFPASGVHVLAGIIEPLTTYEVRIKPETEPQREETWTSWTAVTTGNNTVQDTANVGGTPSATVLASITAAVSDSVLTPGEKVTLVPQLNAVMDWEGLAARAATYGITTERTAYIDAVNTLWTYLLTLTTPVAWNNLSGNTNVVGSTLLSNFQTALTTRTALQTKIDQEAGRRSDTIIGTRPAPEAAIPGVVYLENDGRSYKRNAAGDGWDEVATIGGVFGRDLLEAPGGILATRANFRTDQGIAAGIAGQGGLALKNFVRLGGEVYRQGLGGSLADADVVTIEGTAAGIISQGTLATRNDAAWGTHISGRPTELTDGRVPSAINGSGHLIGNLNAGGTGLVSPVQIAAGAYGTNIAANPEFRGGVSTGWSLYDNSSGGKTSIAVVADNTAPNSSGYVLRVSYDGTGTPFSNPQPGFAGTVQVMSDGGGVSRPGHYSRGSTIQWVIVAKIPAGRNIVFTGNGGNTGYGFEWLTSTAGTGAYQTYVGRLTMGTSGTFHPEGYIYVMDGPNSAFTWDIARFDQIDVTSAAVTFMGRGGLLDEDGVARYKGDLVTGLGTAAAITGQGGLALLNAVDLSTSQVLNKSLANLDSGANTKLGGIAPNAGTSLSLIAQGSVTITGNTVAASALTGSWTSGAYSRDRYTGSAFVSGRPRGAAGYMMIGLTDSPGVSASYTNIDYAWFVWPGGLQIYESGNYITPIGDSWDTNSVFSVEYDGVSVIYRLNGVAKRTVTPVASGRTFAAQIACYGSSVAEEGFTDIQFGSHAQAARLGVNVWNNAGTASLGNTDVITSQGVASAISGQTDWATYTGLTTGAVATRVSRINSSGYGILGSSGLMADETNTYWLTNANTITALGTAAAISGQAATATSSDFSVITGSTKPENNATDDRIPDTRNDNQTPNWYRANFPNRERVEFKDAYHIGIPGIPSGGYFGALTTTVDWVDASGGAVKQVFVSGWGSGGRTWIRAGATTTWGAWQRDYSEIDKPYFGADLLQSEGGAVATNAGYRTADGTAAAIVGQAPAATDATIQAGATVNRITPRARTTLGSAVTNTSNTTWTTAVSVTLSGDSAPLAGGYFEVSYSALVSGNSTLDRDADPGFQGRADVDYRLVSTDLSDGDVRVLQGPLAAQIWMSVSGWSPTEHVQLAAENSDFLNTAAAGGRKIAFQIKCADADTLNSQVAAGATLVARYIK